MIMNLNISSLYGKFPDIPRSIQLKERLCYPSLPLFRGFLPRKFRDGTHLQKMRSEIEREMGRKQKEWAVI
jgi:hypothetical protein